MKELETKKYIEILDKLGEKYDYKIVFFDFIKMCAISIYNSFAKNEELENDYLATIKKYQKEDQELLSEWFAQLIMMYERSNDIVDILGPLYMNKKLNDSRMGQVFTPAHISDLMAEISVGDETKIKNDLEKNGFISICEPCCGAGGMVLALVKALKKRNINYQQQILVQVEDISDICAYMAYVQLSLYGIPAIVCCGDTLSRKMKFCLQTPSFYMQQWKFKDFFTQTSPKELTDNDREKIKKPIIIDSPVINKNLFKEITVKGNCQISLW